MKDPPVNSQLTFEYLLPFQKYFDDNKGWLDSWGNNNVRTFLLLKEGVNVADFSNKFKDEVRKHDKESKTISLFIHLKMPTCMEIFRRANLPVAGSSTSGYFSSSLFLCCSLPVSTS